MLKKSIPHLIFIFILLSLLNLAHVANTGRVDRVLLHELAIAEKLIGKGRYSEALLFLKKIPSNEYNTSVRKSFITVYIGLKDAGNVVKFIKELCKEDIRHYSARRFGVFLRANEYDALDLELSRTLFDEMIKQKNIKPKYWMPLVIALEKSEKEKDLAMVYQTLLKADPSTGVFYANFIIDYFNDTKKAEEILKRTLLQAKTDSSMSERVKENIYQNLAKYYKKMGDIKNLFRHLNDMETSLSENPGALLYVSELYSIYGLYHEAQQVYDKLLDIKGFSRTYDAVKMVKQYADMLVRQGRRDDAVKMLYNHANKTRDKTKKIDYLIKAIDISVNYTLKPNYLEVTKLITMVNALHPEGGNALKLLGFIRELGKFYPEADELVTLGESLYMKKCGARGFNIFSRYLAEIGKTDQAVEVLKKGLTSLPLIETRKQILETALLLTSENRLLDVFKTFKKEYEQYNDYQSNKYLGWIYEIYFDEFNTASQYYQFAFDRTLIKSEKRGIILDIARCRCKEGKILIAEKLITDYFAKHKDITSKYNYLFEFYNLYASNPEKAIAEMETALQVTKRLRDRVDILLNLGDAYLTGDSPRPFTAIKYYKKALKISDDTRIYAKLALTYNNYTKKTGLIRHYLEILLAREPQNTLYLSWHATSLAGYYDTQKDALNVVCLIPSSKRSDYSLACLYAKLGEKKIAVDLLIKDFTNNFSKKGKYERNTQRYWILGDNDLAILYDDPRFVQLTEIEK